MFGKVRRSRSLCAKRKVLSNPQRQVPRRIEPSTTTSTLSPLFPVLQSQLFGTLASIRCRKSSQVPALLSLSRKSLLCRCPGISQCGHAMHPNHCTRYQRDVVAVNASHLRPVTCEQNPSQHASSSKHGGTMITDNRTLDLFCSECAVSSRRH